MRAALWYRSAGILAVMVAALMIGSVMVPAMGSSGGGAATAAPIASTSTPTPATASTAPVSTPGSSGPHPGTVDVYEVAPGGAKTEDPSVAYDTVSYEPIINVYQTLVAYNGSSTTNFVPELATCVPGSVQCTALYGSTLITNNPSTGYPQYFTFVLDSAAHFYDPGTGASWPVFPSDVMFSLSRTTSFADLPGVGVQNGWIQTQALVPFGNSAWDGGIHYPYNNTPSNVLGSMLVNDTAYCPATAMTAANGCITFNASGGGSDWPFFLELVADPLGAGVEPCGWYTAVGASVPGFSGTSAAHGDGPCLLPGGATSTSQTAFQHYLATVSPTAWDSLQGLAASNPQNPQPQVQWSMVGSGPYYTQTINKAIGYVLKANPAYSAPTGCKGQTGCEPLPGTYQGTVNIYWDEDDSQGIANYQAGQADLAAIQLPSHVSTFNTLVSTGKIDYINIPTISVFFMPYNLDFNVSVTATLPNNPSTTNIPGDFFSQVALRQFITNAYPYQTINSSLLQAGGISTGFGYGGAIPKYLGNYYAYNITWPSTDPITDPNVMGSAAWWWAQGNNASSPYYDSELAACTVSNPCTFPIIGETGATFYDSAIPDLIGEIQSLTGNRLMPYTFDLTFPQLITYGFAAPGTNGLTLWNLGWAPDYPDPTDYVVPMYLPDSTYTFGDAVAPELALPQFNLASCPYSANWSNPTDAWAALVYYHSLQELPNGCQGIAYSISNYWYALAAPLSVGPQRTLDYQMANQLNYLLALYIWNFQSSIPATYAPWINGASLNSNVMIGGGGDNTWYNVGYTSGVATATFTQTGLSSGTKWAVTVGGTTLTSITSSISVQLATGTYTYALGFVAGYTVSPATGTVDLTSGPAAVSVTYTAFTSTPTALTFAATGLVTGNGWSVLLTTSGGGGLGQVASQAQAFLIEAPQGSYDYAASSAIGYTLTGGTGTVTVGSAPVTQAVHYTPTFGFTYAIVLTASGLLSGVSWSATINGQTQITTASTLTFYNVNGTYSYTVGASGWAASPSSGTFVLKGATSSQGAVVITQPVSFVFVHYTITYNQLGLSPSGTITWSVAVNGHSQTGTGSTTSLVFTFTNSTTTNTNFTYLVTPPAGYTVSPVGGTLTFGTGDQIVNLTFTTVLGTLVLTGLPSSSSVSVGGVQQTSCPTVSGSCTVSGIAAGTVAYEVQASGYYTYFNNATITGGGTTNVPVSMTSVPSSSPAWSYLSTLAYILIAVLAVLVVVFIVTTVMMRGGKPPMTQPPESWKGSDNTTTPSEPPK